MARPKINIDHVDDLGNPLDAKTLQAMNAFILKEIPLIDEKRFFTSGMRYKEAKRRFYEKHRFGAYHKKFDDLFSFGKGGIIEWVINGAKELVGMGKSDEEAANEAEMNALLAGDEGRLLTDDERKEVLGKLKKGGEINKCPVGTHIQTLLLDKGRFNKSEAKKWAKDNKFKYGKVDEKENTFRLRQKDPTEYEEKSFRTIELTEGVKAVIGCPKNNMEEGGKVNKFKVGDILDVPKLGTYTILEDLSEGENGDYYAFESDGKGNATPSSTFGYLIHSNMWSGREPKKIGYRKLPTVTLNVDDSTYILDQSGDEMIDTEMYGIGMRYQLFKEHAPAHLKKRFAEQQDANEHTKNSQMIQGFLEEGKMEKGGEIDDDNIGGMNQVGQSTIHKLIREYAPETWKTLKENDLEDQVKGGYAKPTGMGGYSAIFVYEKDTPDAPIWLIYPSNQYMEKGGEVKIGINWQSDFGEDQDFIEEVIQEHIADMVEDGYTSGQLSGEEPSYQGWWTIDIQEDEEDEEIRNEEIARLIREGYTSGYDPTFSWEATVGLIKMEKGGEVNRFVTKKIKDRHWQVIDSTTDDPIVHTVSGISLDYFTSQREAEHVRKKFNRIAAARMDDGGSVKSNIESDFGLGIGIREILAKYNLSIDELENLLESHANGGIVNLIQEGSYYDIHRHLEAEGKKGNLDDEDIKYNAIRDVFLENEGVLDSKKWDNTVSIWKLEPEWKGFKGAMEVETEGGKYINPYHIATLNMKSGGIVGRVESEMENGRIHVDKLTEILGHKPHSVVQHLEQHKLEKCLYAPCYTLTKY